MESTVIEFDKLLQDRLEEYKNIFTLSSEVDEKRYPFAIAKCVLGNQINDIWRNHLSVVGNCWNGWKALWRISIRKCYLMNIKHPANVIVKVCSIQWESFSADVEVLRVGDADVPSSKRIAPLIELFPIEQDFEGDTWTIANELDKYRFFYQHVWFPWDDYDDDAAGWIEAHLEGRLQLLYDMVTGEVNAEDSERIRYLLCEARKIQEEVEETETLIEELKGGLNGEEQNKDYINNEDMENLRLQVCKVDIQNENEKSKQTEREESLIVHMVELQKRMEVIQQEVAMLEDPFLRNALANEKIRRRKMEVMINSNVSLNTNNNKSKKEEILSPEIALIWEQSTIVKLKTFLSSIESNFGKETKCAIYPSLQQAVDERIAESTSFFVCSGIHRLKHTEELLYPGTFIAGFSQDYERRNTVIVGHSLGKVIMIVDWLGKGISLNATTEMAKLENLHLDPYGVEAVLLVDKGAVRVNNCYISHEEINPKLSLVGGFKMPSTSVLQTYSGYKPHQNMKRAYGDCSSYSMPILPLSAAFELPPLRGIAVGAGGRLEASGCHFQELHVGIIIYSGAKVHLSGCTFSKCQVAIRIIIGAEVVVEGCSFEHNKMYAIHICVGAPEEHDEEMKDIMGGDQELFTSTRILERIPGVTLKNCIFTNSAESSEVRLSSVNEVHLPVEKEEPGTYTNQAMEDLADDDIVCISDEEPELDDSIVVLSDGIRKDNK